MHQRIKMINILSNCISLLDMKKIVISIDCVGPAQNEHRQQSKILAKGYV
jgi:hypothetical protein